VLSSMQTLLGPVPPAVASTLIALGLPREVVTAQNVSSFMNVPQEEEGEEEEDNDPDHDDSDYTAHDHD
jgi:hypothetical protein